MRIPIAMAVILLIVNALVDLYIYAALHSYTRSMLWPRLQLWTSVGFLCLIIAASTIVFLKVESLTLPAMWCIFTYMSVYMAKYLFVIFDVLSRLPFIWSHPRWEWMSWLGLGFGLVVFGLMWWGSLYNRYQIDEKQVEMPIAGLASEFDGLKIVQISDMHVGSYGSSTRFVDKLVDSINAVHPDIIVFTGDIVNQYTDELKPFVNSLKRLHAPMGVYSILGNHDYGDYASWSSPEEKKQNLALLKKTEAEMGWKMLNNESVTLTRGDGRIVLIGVENIAHRPFKTYGDLAKAYPNIGDGNTKILLSHNPDHWVDDISDNPNSNIALTLSGHTHAMQVKLFGFSPAKWSKNHWGGLYEDQKGQKLYINIGTGVVGFPARIGATPEITVFTLKSKQP